MQRLDIVLKCNAVLIYILLKEAVPKSNCTWGKRIQVVVTYGLRDKIRQGMLFSNDYVYNIY